MQAKQWSSALVAQPTQPPVSLSPFTSVFIPPTRLASVVVALRKLLWRAPLLCNSQALHQPDLTTSPPSNLTTATTFASTFPLHPAYRLCHPFKMPPKASKAAADSKSKATTKAMPKSSAKAATKTKTRGVEKKKKGMFTAI
jgi:hypothetical protein